MTKKPTKRNEFRELEELEATIDKHSYMNFSVGRIGLKKALQQADRRGYERAIDKMRDSSVWQSKNYKKVIKHRGGCPCWRSNPKLYCLDCNGGGLNKFTEDYLKELKNRR